MAYRPPYIDERAINITGPHPATLEEPVFLSQCSIETGRVAGPGGQHRNRVDTAVFIKHVPTGVETHATERRSQAQNRHKAIFRLRLKLACNVRTLTSRDRHQVSELWARRRQGEKMPVNPEHEDFPALLAEALDVIVARRYDVAGAAGLLGITMSQLTRLVRNDRRAFARINEGREAIGLPKLRS
ncbi:MAG: peptide chain release factor family protein [Phycisphaerales bacterium]